MSSWVLAASLALAAIACSAAPDAEGRGNDAAQAGGSSVAGAGSGTAGSDGAPGAAEDTMSPCPQTYPGGSYFVPVPDNLTVYATYPVGPVVFCVTNGVAHLGYKLPALLLGTEQQVYFSGPHTAGSMTVDLTGENGTASCALDGKTWTCNENFNQVTLRPTELDAALSGLEAAEAQGRRDVSARFSQDPIGVLTFVEP